ncbi:MAG: hypothetical protein K2W91_11040 [Novosphingobium sp.]|nr:hypothetical protein [Novosphingobium sp.]
MNPVIRIRAATLALLASLQTASAWADSPAKPAPVPVSYADLADLADATPLVIRTQPRKIIKLEPERARGLRPGWARFYIEAKTEALIAGTVPLGGALTYLVDLPLDPKGKPPAIKKKSVVLFARPVPGRPGELQLVASDAQLLWDPALELRIKALLGELYAPGAPHRITGVREAIHVGGELAGEGETQIFLTAANGEPAAIAVNRKPGQVPRWGVSFSELLASDAAPRRDSLGWYRLACFLPRELPGTANVSERSADRAAAAADYAFVIGQLGPCQRTRK